MALTVLSRYHWLGNNLDAAIATNLEALEKLKQGDFLYWIEECLRNQALLMVDKGMLHRAATLLAAVSQTDRASDRDDQRTAIDKIRASLTRVQFESAWAEGLAMDAGESIRFASNLD
jgi:hypothetical protein